MNASVTAKIAAEHCEGCGATGTDLEVFDGGSYTTCCNEPVCSGGAGPRWQLSAEVDAAPCYGEDTVRACCGNYAESFARAHGVAVLYLAD